MCSASVIGLGMWSRSSDVVRVGWRSCDAGAFIWRTLPATSSPPSGTTESRFRQQGWVRGVMGKAIKTKP